MITSIDAVLFAGKLEDDSSFARADIEINEDNLLPCPQHQLAVGEGNSNGKTEQGSADVGIAVAVAPAGIVLVGDVLRRESRPHFFEIGDKSRLVLHDGHTAGSMGAENCDRAFTDAGFSEALFNIRGDIDDIGIALRFNFE